MTSSVPRVPLGQLGTLQQGWPGKPRQTAAKGRQRPTVLARIMTTRELDSIGAVPIEPAEAIEGFSPRYQLARGDVLFNSRNRPFRASVIEGLAPAECVVASGILAFLRLHDPKTVEPYYLAGLLRSPYGQTLIQPYLQPSTNTTTLNLKTFAQLQVPLPDWDTQQRLARMFQDLEEVRRCADRLVEQRLNYVDAMLRWTVKA